MDENRVWILIPWLIKSYTILGNPGVTHSVPTAFVMNAVGTEWVMPGLPMMELHIIEF